MVSVPGSSSQLTRQQFARMLRERFLAEAAQAMMDIGGVVHERLTALMDEPATARESQERRDVWMAYKKCRPLWVESTKTVWRECLEPPAVRKQLSTEPAGLQLVGTEVVENKILASRLVMAVMDKVSGQYEDLRLRLRHLEGMDELPGNDLLRPEVLVLLMVEQWAKSGMPGDSWSMVNEAVQKLLIERLKNAYANANAVLINKGIMPTIELKDRVKSPVRGSGSPTRARTVSGSSTAQQELQGGQASHDGSGRNGTGHFARPGPSESNSAGSYSGAEGAAPQSDNGHMGGRPGWGGHAPHATGRRCRFGVRAGFAQGAIGCNPLLEAVVRDTKWHGARSLRFRGNPDDDCSNAHGSGAQSGARCDGPNTAAFCQPCGC
jgi:hypothetical protein